ncbi:hypothetical protein Bbelb_208180 [Branchiostoma belcheri]|nr:hypothetical protein Bbelb_208180 [Branchiostoma belcheri]
MATPTNLGCSMDPLWPVMYGGRGHGRAPRWNAAKLDIDRGQQTLMPAQRKFLRPHNKFRISEVYKGRGPRLRRCLFLRPYGDEDASSRPSPLPTASLRIQHESSPIKPGPIILGAALRESCGSRGCGPHLPASAAAGTGAPLHRAGRARARPGFPPAQQVASYDVFVIPIVS